MLRTEGEREGTISKLLDLEKHIVFVTVIFQTPKRLVPIPSSFVADIILFGGFVGHEISLILIIFYCGKNTYPEIYLLNKILGLEHI